MRLVRAAGRAVEELAGELVPCQPPIIDELAQRVLGADTEQVVQLVDEVSGFGVVDERLRGCEQGAGAGEADSGEGPQAALVEVGELVESVVAAAMRVAGAGADVLELAERGAPAGAGAERGHHVGQRGDGLVAEQGDDRVGGELGWSHYDTIAGSHFRNDAINPDGLHLSESRKYPSWQELVADHESCGAGVPYCETAGASRKLFLRGPLVVRMDGYALRKRLPTRSAASTRCGRISATPGPPTSISNRRLQATSTATVTSTCGSTASAAPTYSSHFMVNSGDGTFTIDEERAPTALRYNPPEAWYHLEGHLVDLNNDGDIDLALAQNRGMDPATFNQSSIVLINEGTGHYPAHASNCRVPRSPTASRQSEGRRISTSTPTGSRTCYSCTLATTMVRRT